MTIDKNHMELLTLTVKASLDNIQLNVMDRCTITAGRIDNINDQIQELENKRHEQREVLIDHFTDLVALTALNNNLYQRGNYKIELIKFVRKISPVGLKDAKEYVEMLLGGPPV